MTNTAGSRASLWATGLLLCIAVAGALLAITRASRPDAQRAGILPLDDAHMPLEISGPEELERLLLGLRSYQYRARRRAATSVREYYYDTPDWTLARRGHTCALARRLDEDGGVVYAVRFAGLDEDGTVEVELELRPSLGEAIVAGAELPVDPALRAALDALGVEAEQLAVRGIGEAVIDHLDVRDKGRTWFELDYEEWAFSVPGTGDEPFRWYGISLRPADAAQDEEFTERVQQMERVLPTFYRFRSAAAPRLVRALEQLERLDHG